MKGILYDTGPGIVAPQESFQAASFISDEKTPHPP